MFCFLNHCFVLFYSLVWTDLTKINSFSICWDWNFDRCYWIPCKVTVFFWRDINILSFINYSPTYRAYPVCFMFFHVGRTATGTSRAVGGVDLNCFFSLHCCVAFDRYKSTPSWSIIINGIPYLNFLCIVLWCQTFIPNHAPILPPIIASRSRVVSGIRHFPFLAFNLSTP